MTIGIPRALAYYRYSHLWETFFDQCKLPYILSPDTNTKILQRGSLWSVDENCLPLKLFMGHVEQLLAHTEYIFVPYLKSQGRKDEFCVRFWGLPDVVRASFPQAKVISYTLSSKSPVAQARAFVALGTSLGVSPQRALMAYQKASQAQNQAQGERLAQAQEKLTKTKPKILVAGQSYVVNDPLAGKMVTGLIEAQGGVALTCDAWPRDLCQKQAQKLSKDLPWGLNREILGAIYEAQGQVEGIILLTAFPCGSDCLANELVLRRVKQLPVMQILLDEHMGQEGLRTRIESFMDMLEAQRQRRRVV